MRAARDLGDFLEHHVHVPEALLDGLLKLQDKVGREAAISNLKKVA